MIKETQTLPDSPIWYYMLVMIYMSTVSASSQKKIFYQITITLHNFILWYTFKIIVEQSRHLQTIFYNIMGTMLQHKITSQWPQCLLHWQNNRYVSYFIVFEKLCFTLLFHLLCYSQYLTEPTIVKYKFIYVVLFCKLLWNFWTLVGRQIDIYLYTYRMNTWNYFE